MSLNLPTNLSHNMPVEWWSYVVFEISLQKESSQLLFSRIQAHPLDGYIFFQLTDRVPHAPLLGHALIFHFILVQFHFFLDSTTLH